MRSSRHFAALLCASLSAACHHTRPAFDVSGLTIRVVTAADTTARVATVRLRNSDDAPPIPLSQDADGRFHGTLPAETRRMVLDVAVPEHISITTALWIPADLSGEIVIRPQALIPRRTVAKVRVVGDFNDFNSDSAVELTGIGDGHLRAAIPFRGDSARFNVLGLGGGSRGAWMKVKSWALIENEYGPPHYAGVLRPVRDTLFFDVDTTPLRRFPPPLTIAFATRDTALESANRLLLDRMAAMKDPEPASWWAPTTALPAIIAARREPTKRAHEALATATDSRVREEAATSIMVLTPMTRDSMRVLGALYLANVAPGSVTVRDQDGVSAASRAIGGLAPDSTADAATRDRAEKRIIERVRSYLLPVARTTPDSSPRINAWLGAAYSLANLRDTSALYSVIDEAVAAMPGNRFISNLPAAMGRDRVLRAGALFPTFRLTAIGGGSTDITNASFHGKLTLIDFWGTWCGPCVTEMPFLHRAYERFKDRGFTILSIAAEESVADVARFRKEKFPMPWLNAWAGGQAADTPSLKALGVMHFPLAVLLDGSGRIIAVDDGLRGDALEKTLERLLP
jgi:thiol-disulfide isomerase/thioredoxin